VHSKDLSLIAEWLQLLGVYRSERENFIVYTSGHTNCRCRGKNILKI
jgi:hypothetical protein